MKKLKLTIDGEVKTFDLPENEEYKVEVVNKYEAKVGDCVMYSINGSECAIFFKIVAINDAGNMKYEHSVGLYKGKYIIDLDGGWFLGTTIFTQIIPEELKEKYTEAGYDWYYETNGVKELKWMPKHKDKVWFLNSLCEPVSFAFNKNYMSHQSKAEKGLLFQTEEKCEEFSKHCISYINNKKE